MWKKILIIAAFALAASFSLGIRYLVDNMGEYREILGQYLPDNETLSVSFGGIDSNGWRWHPEITVRDIQVTMPGREIRAEKISVSWKIFSSLLFFEPRIHHLRVSGCRVRGPRASLDNAGAVFFPQNIDHILVTKCRLPVAHPDGGKKELALERARFQKKWRIWNGAARLTLAGEKAKEKIQGRGRFKVTAKGRPIRLDGHLAVENLDVAWLAGLVSKEPLEIVPQAVSGDLWMQYGKDRAGKIQATLRSDSVEWPRHQSRGEDVNVEMGALFSGEGNFFLEMQKLSLRYHGREINTSFAASKKGGDYFLQSASLPLPTLAHVAEKGGLINEGWQSKIRAMSPRGRLFDIRLRVPARGDWSLRLKGEELALSPVGRLPGIDNLSLALDAGPKQGSARLYARETRLEMKRLFEDKLLSYANARLLWKTAPDALVIRSDEFHTRFSRHAGEVSGDLRFTLPRGGGDGPVVDMDFTGQNIPMRDALRYIPHKGRAKAPGWLFGGIAGGYAHQVEVNISNRLRELGTRPVARVRGSFSEADVHLAENFFFKKARGTVDFSQKRLNGSFEFDRFDLEGTAWGAGSAELETRPGAFTFLAKTPTLEGVLKKEEGKQDADFHLDIKKIILPEKEKGGLSGWSKNKRKISLKVVVRELIAANGEAWGGGSFFVNLSPEFAKIGELNWDVEKKKYAVRGGEVTSTQINGSALNTLKGDFLFCGIEGIIKARACPGGRDKYNNRARLDIQWRGELEDLKPEESTVNFSFELKEGSFVKSSPKLAIRLFALFNFDQLVRRLGANFRSLNDAGFTYSKVRAAGILSDGTVRFGESGMRVDSSGGKFQLNAELDIKKRQIDGVLTSVLPTAENLPWLSLLLGFTPQTAVGVAVVRQFFKEDIEKFSTVRHRVSGSWDEPALTLIREKK